MSGSSRWPRWVAWCALLGIVLRLSSEVSAQADEASYDARIRAALAAQAAKDFEGAHSAFEAAHELEPSARTLRGMGVASFQAGHLARAVSELEAAMVHATKPLDERLREAVRALVARARAQLASLSLNVSPHWASVKVDDGAPLSEPGEILLSPGPHRLEVSAPGFVPEQFEFEAIAGAAQRLGIELRAKLAVPPPTAEEAPARRPNAGPGLPARPKELPARRWLRQAGLAGLAVGAASAGAGLVVYYGLGRNRVSEIAADCEAKASGGCLSDELDRKVEEAHLVRLARTTTALWVTTGICAAGGATSLGLSVWGLGRSEVRLSSSSVTYSARF